jgi:hypothetical protein
VIVHLNVVRRRLRAVACRKKAAEGRFDKLGDVALGGRFVVLDDNSHAFAQGNQ